LKPVLINYLSTEENSQSQKILEKIGLSIPSDNIESAKKHREWRRIIQFSLHNQIPLRSGAKYYTPFFIRSNEEHRDFWLIHLSGHARARDVMVGLHWDECTHFAHYGGSGLKMLGYDKTKDENVTKQPLLIGGYYFDQTALASSQEELRNQLPKRIRDQYREGIPFKDFFANVTNETPITSDIMKDVLSELAAEGIIEVRDESGTKKRKPKINKNTDIIIINKQMKLF
jgi:hypothetical protein